MANEAAWQSGAALGSRLAAQRRERKQALSDQEFEYHASLLADELAGNRKQLGTIDQVREPDKYKSKVADLENNLQALRELYHPDRHPNAVVRFGHLITDKLGLTSPKKRLHKVQAVRAAAAAGDRQEAEQLARSTPQAANANPEKLYRDNLVAAGFTGPQADLALRVKAGVEARAVAERPEHQSDFQKGLTRFAESKGDDEPTSADETAYRRSLHPAPAAKPQHESDYLAGLKRFVKGRGHDPNNITSADELAYRRLLHPARTLKDLKGEAERRKPKKREKSTRPAYDWSLDPTHQQPTPQVAPH